jgi:hypothetical protein
MLPEFEGIEDRIPRPYRTALCAAVSDRALRIERLGSRWPICTGICIVII